MYEVSTKRFINLLHWLVLGVLLLVTWAAWDTARQTRDADLSNYFELRVRDAVRLTSQRMLAQEQVLRGVKGLFVSSDEVTRRNFHEYIRSLYLDENFPGILGVGYALVVPDREREKLTASIHREGLPEYRLWPDGKRELYTTIIYLEPFSGRNLRAFGYDMYSNPVRREAMERSRDSGVAALTGKVELVQETDQDVQAGFLIYLPVYRQGKPHNSLEERRTNIIGWVYSPMRMNDLARGMYGEEADDLDIEIYDGKQIAPETLMYESYPAAGENVVPSLVSVLQLEFAGHAWTMRIRGLPGIAKRVAAVDPGVIAFDGIFASVLLSLLTWVLSTGRARAMQYARELNRELSFSEERAKNAIAASNTAIWDFDLQTGKVHLSESWSKMRGGDFLPTDTTIRELSDLVPETEQQSVRNAIVLAAKGQNASAYRVIHRVRRFDGAYIWVRSEGRVVERTADGMALRMVGTNQDITEKKLADDALERTLMEVEDLYDHAPCGYHSLDAEGVIVKMNNTELQWLGYSREEVTGRKKLTDFLTPSSVGIFQDRFPEFKKLGFIRDLELEVSGKDGVIRNWLVNSTAIYDANGDFSMTRSSVFDISNRKKMQEKIAMAETNLRAIIDNVPFLIWMKDTEGRFVTVNRAFLESTGLKNMDEIVGKTDLDLWPAELADKYRADDIEIMNKRMQKQTEERSMDQGMATWVETTKTPVISVDGTLLGIAGFARDITSIKLSQEQVQHLAHHDTLTGLPNRTLLNDRLRQALATARRDKSRLALIFLDLDKFKPINDTYGHHIGDLVLKAASKRMQECVRESDTVARFGGDEFMVLLPEIGGEHDARGVAEKIRQALSRPFHIAEHQFEISSSLGIAIYPQHGKNEIQLIKCADMAMYYAKSAGRNTVKVYQPDM